MYENKCTKNFDEGTRRMWCRFMEDLTIPFAECRYDE